MEAVDLADNNVALQCTEDMTIITDYQTTLALYEALGALLEWNGQRGGYDAPCWRRAKALQRRLQKYHAKLGRHI